MPVFRKPGMLLIISQQRQRVNGGVKIGRDSDVNASWSKLLGRTWLPGSQTTYLLFLITGVLGNTNNQVYEAPLPNAKYDENQEGHTRLNLLTYHFHCPTHMSRTTLTFRWKSELKKHNRISRIEACVWKTVNWLLDIWNKPTISKDKYILRTSRWT